MTTNLLVTANFAIGPVRIVTGPGPGARPNVRGFSGHGRPTSADFLAYPWTFTGGVFVAVGRQGGEAMIVTGSGAGAPSLVHVFKADGTPRATSFSPYPASSTGGVRVAACDFERNGGMAIVVGPGPGSPPTVRVVKLSPDGRPVRDLARFSAYAPSVRGGLFVACGDITGDRIPDIITGPDSGATPEVRAFRLRPGAPGGVVHVLSFLAFDPSFAGGVRVAAGNLDGSDRASIIAGAGPGDVPRVRTFKFVAGSVRSLGTFLAYPASFRGGVFVAAGNATRDGRAQIVTGAGQGGSPQVRVFTGTGTPVGVTFLAYPLSFGGGVSVAVPPFP
jgi:hypothetical protein